MRISDILKTNKVTVSCEMFPPKPGKPLENTQQVVHEIAAYKPSFMSVTYGAGGSNSKNTLSIAEEVQKSGVTALAHLTCVGQDEENLRASINAFKASDIENILALRGDIPEGDTAPQTFPHASDLINAIRREGADFCIGGACYPEGHPESYNSDADIDGVRRKVESESAVSRAKANAGLKADIYLRFGLTQTADKLKDAYRNPLDQQYVSLGITLPILDWGRGRGQVRVARSNRDLVYTQVEQDKTDFDLNVRKLVKQFNLQAQRVNIAARTDHTAQRRAEVARKLYLLGKSSVLDLNASITEKDTARRSYITALYNYWSLYYTLRSITLYDFEKERPLAEDLERVTNEESIQ